ncbi:MAG: Fic family protein, partial [bacterium]|nr:Fic family protein [bacterium]
MVKKEVKKRKYLGSHPWISFKLNTSAFDPKIWMLLGESHSKCQHIAGVPLKPEAAEELHRVYLFKGASATTAIEGNT